MRKYLWILVAVAITGGLVLGGGLSDPARADKPQTQCPVMGGAIDKNVYVDYQGKRIYFCCPACVPQFNQDPEKYLKKMAEEGITPEPVPGAPGKKTSKAPNNKK